MDIVAFRAILSINNYKWDYWTFCNKLGLTAGDGYAQELWKAFKDAAVALNRFDEDKLRIIFSED